MYFITVPVLAQKLRDQGKQVIELKPDRALLPQLLCIPTGADIMATVPEDWSTEIKERFTMDIHEALTSIEISRNTVNRFQEDWENNAFWNYEASIKAKPIHQLKKTGDYALIAGSGPSAKDPVVFSHPQVFAAWSSPLAYLADLIGHCDHRCQSKAIEEPKQGIIFTPSAAKEFVCSFPNSIHYVYLNRGNRYDWRFAEKRMIPDHNPIAGNVVDMLVQSAIYAGHTIIKLIGVDLSCKTPEEVLRYHPNSIEVFQETNYLGQPVYGDEVFRLYKQGLEALVLRHPEIQFSV